MQILKNQEYVGIITGKNGGKRSYREMTFIASRDQQPETYSFVGHEAPAQDLVYIWRSSAFPGGEQESTPQLFVSGSIKAAPALSEAL